MAFGLRNAITDVPGIAVGNAEDALVSTGVTVVLPDEPAVASVDVASVGIAGGLPRLAWLDFEMPPLAWATLWIILPYALILAGVGLIESLMTMTLIDELTETRGRGNRECVGQGVANVTCGIGGQVRPGVGSGRHRLGRRGEEPHRAEPVGSVASWARTGT